MTQATGRFKQNTSLIMSPFPKLGTPNRTELCAAHSEHGEMESKASTWGTNRTYTVRPLTVSVDCAVLMPRWALHWHVTAQPGNSLQHTPGFTALEKQNVFLPSTVMCLEHAVLVWAHELRHYEAERMTSSHSG